MTDTKTDEQYVLAQAMTAEYSRVLSLCERINERNRSYGEEWEEIVDRIVDEYIGDPLSIEWEGTCSTNPAYAEASDWDVTAVEVVLGTGGPARGITFRNGYAYCWHQDWFTPRVHDVKALDGAEILAGRWGIESF